jgi:hypothetical protein
MADTFHMLLLFWCNLILFRIHRFQHQQVKLNFRSVFIYVLFYLFFITHIKGIVNAQKIEGFMHNITRFMYNSHISALSFERFVAVCCDDTIAVCA